MNTNIQISNDDFNLAKSRDLISVKCHQCNNIFHREKHYIQARPCLYCGIKCKGLSSQKRIECKCQTCNKQIWKWPCDIKEGAKIYCSKKCLTFRVTRNCSQCGAEVTKSRTITNQLPRSFCNKTCAGIYTATHKTWGYRRSKLEKWIEEQLTLKYPTLAIDYNKTDAINAELDIYIPSLKVAFELNGIFHYENIFGSLSRTQTNGHKKFQLCILNGISLCVIDTYNCKYHKKERSQKFLDIITNIIDEKLLLR